jgi:hypothetical protein
VLKSAARHVAFPEYGDVQTIGQEAFEALAAQDTLDVGSAVRKKQESVARAHETGDEHKPPARGQHGLQGTLQPTVHAR